MNMIANFKKSFANIMASHAANVAEQKAQRKYTRDTIDTGLGLVPRLAADGGHDLVFKETVERPDGGLNVVYLHPTKRSFTHSGHPIRGRAMVVPLEKARIPA